MGVRLRRCEIPARETVNNLCFERPRSTSEIARRRLTIPCLSAKRYVYVWDDICRRLKSKTMALVSTAI